MLLAVLSRSGSLAGYDPGATAAFVWLGQGLLAVVLLWDDGELAQRVRTGDIAIDLARPCDPHAAFLATDLGRAGHAVLVRLIPPVVLGALLFPFRWPHAPSTWVWFVASVLLAVVLCAQIRFLIGLSAFWLLDARGVRSLWGTVSGVVCGLVVPLSYFPAWAETALRALPFADLIQTPIDVFTEHAGPAHLVAHQLVWAVVLLAAGRFVLARATTRLVVQGG